MAFLDFIKNRQQQPADTAQRKPETAKEMYTREAAQDRASAKALSQISPEQQARVDAVKSDLTKATQRMGQDAQAPSAAPTNSTASPQPMAQMSMNQDKAAPALSPTSAQAGTRVNEQDAPGGNSAAKTPTKSQERPQTIARPTPSWER